MKKDNFIKRFLHKLVEARWFYTFSASATATIVGISLTFGINSCRETSRKKAEAEKSLIQAVGNIKTRLDQVKIYSELINQQNEIYFSADSILKESKNIPDSICVEFQSRLLQQKMLLSDHDFEKIFLESYQIWQILDNNELTGFVQLSFTLLRQIEEYELDYLKSLFKHIEDQNVETPFIGRDAAYFTKSMCANTQFQFYMAVRDNYAHYVVQLIDYAEFVYGKIIAMCKEARYDVMDTTENEEHYHYNSEDESGRD